MPSPVASPQQLSIAPDAVVLFIDIQKGIADSALTIDGKHLRRGVDALARLAKIFALPVVVAAVSPDGSEPKIFEEIDDRLGPQPTLVRDVPCSMNDAAIRGAIEATGRKTLLISGVVTEIAVQLPAIAAAAAGYTVHVVVDACGGSTERTEEAAFRRMTQAGVLSTSIVTLAAELAGGFTSEEGQAAMALLFEIHSKK